VSDKRQTVFEKGIKNILLKEFIYRPNNQETREAIERRLQIFFKRLMPFPVDVDCGDYNNPATHIDEGTLELEVVAHDRVFTFKMMRPGVVTCDCEVYDE